MTETKIDKKERKLLKITWVKPEPEKFGQWGKKLKFNCEDGLQCETIKPHLFPYIKQDAELDADTELQIVKFDDGGEMPKWVVTEIYEDGDPVKAPAKVDSSRTPRQYGRDEERVDQRTFVMETGQDLRAGLIDKKHPFVIARQKIMASWISLEVSKIKEETSQPPLPKAEVPKLTINMDWLSESVKKIWPEKSNIHFAQFLIETYGIVSKPGIDLMLKQLTQSQQADLSGKLTKMLNKTS